MIIFSDPRIVYFGSNLDLWDSGLNNKANNGKAMGNGRNYSPQPLVIIVRGLYYLEGRNVIILTGIFL